MSQFTSEAIKNQMTHYDSIVRKAVNDGNLSTVIAIEGEVVRDKILFFYSINNKF